MAIISVVHMKSLCMEDYVRYSHLGGRCFLGLQQLVPLEELHLQSNQSQMCQAPHLQLTLKK